MWRNGNAAGGNVKGYKDSEFPTSLLGLCTKKVKICTYQCSNNCMRILRSRTGKSRNTMHVHKQMSGWKYVFCAYHVSCKSNDHWHTHSMGFFKTLHCLKEVRHKDQMFMTSLRWNVQSVQIQWWKVGKWLPGKTTWAVTAGEQGASHYFKIVGTVIFMNILKTTKLHTSKEEFYTLWITSKFKKESNRKQISLGCASNPFRR